MNKVKFKVRPNQKFYESTLKLKFATSIPDVGALEKRKRYFVFIDHANKESLKGILELFSQAFQRNVWRGEFNYEHDLLKNFENILARDLQGENRTHDGISFSLTHSDCMVFSSSHVPNISKHEVKKQITTNSVNRPLMFAYEDMQGRKSIRFVEKLEHFADYFTASSPEGIRNYRYENARDLRFSKYDSIRTSNIKPILYEIHMDLDIKGRSKETFLKLALEEISSIKDCILENRQNTLLRNYLKHELYWKD